MGVFEEVNKKIGKQIKVFDANNTDTTILDFDYSKGVNGPITVKHCEKCVAVNKCWFKDEKDKKTEPYPILGIDWLDNIANAITPGLYHYKCHCNELSIVSPTEDQIELIIPNGKEDWLFKDKQDWIKSLGYIDNNKFLNTLYELIKKAYCDGNYKIIDHDKYGVKANFYITIPGDTIKKGHDYNIKSAFMIFPEGKLKCNTLMGGKFK